MMYFITGNSGTGKTTVATELAKRGFEVHDVDDFLARWRNNITGYVHPKSSIKSKDRTPQFLKQHSWVVERKMMESLAQNTLSRKIFVVGFIYNFQEVADLFEKIFLLDVRNEVLEKRLISRTNNDWGKTTHELKTTLDRQVEIRKVYQSLGGINIDADRPIFSVVDDITARI